MGHPCLYNLTDDPFERRDIAIEKPAVLAKLKTRLIELQQGYYVQTPRSVLRDNGYFCEAAATRGGFVGPWLD
jgi:hypothetical protein